VVAVPLEGRHDFSGTADHHGLAFATAELEFGRPWKFLNEAR
jgi:hypothetical protein